MNRTQAPAVAFLAFTFLFAGTAIAESASEESASDESASGESASNESALPVVGDVAPPADVAPSADGAPDAETKGKMVPTAIGAAIGAGIGAVLIGGGAFVVFPMLTPELEQIGIGGGEAWMVSIGSIAIGVPVGALIGGVLGGAVGHRLAPGDE